MTEVKTETTIATKHSHILLPSSVSLTSSLIRSKLVCSASAYGDVGGGGATGGGGAVTAPRRPRPSPQLPSAMSRRRRRRPTAMF